MPSFSDSIFIFILALMLFGPKKLPQLAKQLGKLMGEFRRASNEFRMQMEDELRIEEQKEHQQKIAALAGPPSADIATEDPPHPHMPMAAPMSLEPLETTAASAGAEPAVTDAEVAKPVRTAIAESGSLKMMPPSTGLPLSHRNGRVAVFSDAEEPALAENSILLPAESSSAGISSEEPVAVESVEEPVHHA